jgi:Flp pilus assembly protein TadG
VFIKDEEGVAAVEFAIIAALFFVLLFGIIEFSLALYDKAVITNASREGARTAILFTEPDPTSGCYVDAKTEAEVQAVVEGYVTNRLISFSAGPPAVGVEADPGMYDDNDSNGCLSRGDYRTVRVTFSYDFLVLPDLRGILSGEVEDSQVNLGAETTMRME